MDDLDRVVRDAIEYETMAGIGVGDTACDRRIELGEALRFIVVVAVEGTKLGPNDMDLAGIDPRRHAAL